MLGQPGSRGSRGASARLSVPQFPPRKQEGNNGGWIELIVKQLIRVYWWRLKYTPTKVP